MDKKDATDREKNRLFAMLKESMSKANSGCGPGCGCQFEETKDGEDSRNDAEKADLAEDSNPT